MAPRGAARSDGCLCEPLAGLAITDYEHRRLEWLAGFDTSTVAVFAALLHRARAGAALDQEPRGARDHVLARQDPVPESISP